jgi:hypothetical protein
MMPVCAGITGSSAFPEQRGKKRCGISPGSWASCWRWHWELSMSCGTKLNILMTNREIVLPENLQKRTQQILSIAVCAAVKGSSRRML